MHCSERFAHDSPMRTVDRSAVKMKILKLNFGHFNDFRRWNPLDYLMILSSELFTNKKLSQDCVENRVSYAQRTIRMFACTVVE